MAEQGWIKLHRCIRSSWVWNDKPFNRGSAWVDLIMMANHEDKKIIFNGTLTEVKRGSCITSIRKLGERWGWSRNKVNLFLEQLKDDGMISYKKDTKKTALTIENYGLYQSRDLEKSHQKDTEGTVKDIKRDTEGHQKDTNKNDKEYIKNDKEGKEEPSMQSSPIFPTPYHQIAFDNFGEIAYKTWFASTTIKENNQLLEIVVDNELKKSVIQDRYLKSLSLLTGKKISVKEEC